VGATAVGFCSRLTDATVDCSLSGSNTIAAGAAVTVTARGVINPAASGVFTLSTTADVDRRPSRSRSSRHRASPAWP